MRRLAWIVLIFAWGCEEPSRPRTATDLLCHEHGEPPAYGEFYWDEVRRSDRPSFDRAQEICSRRCPGSAPCGPVLSVARWYSEPAEVFEALDETTIPEGVPAGEEPAGASSGEE